MNASVTRGGLRIGAYVRTTDDIVDAFAIMCAVIEYIERTGQGNP